MKKLLLALFLIIISLRGIAGTVTAATSKGNWNTASTWDSGTVPTGGDVVVIPSGDTVIVSNTVDDANKNITIINYGNLSFSGGNTQLKLGPQSQVMVYPAATITNGTGNGSHLIVIGGNQVYKGVQGTVLGPQYATSTTSGFIPFVPLPLQFVSFSVNLQNDVVNVEWTTAQEVEVDHYEVERSTDGRSWNVVARLNARGNSTQQTDYSYVDKGAPQAQTFYRIKEVDRSGVFTYSAIKCVNTAMDLPNALSIYSNGTGSVILHFTKPLSGSYMIRIVSFSGQVIKQQALSSPVGEVVLSTGLHGDYVLQLTNGKDVQVARQLIL
jgi:G8 domain